MAKLKHMFKKTAVLFRDREDRNQEKKEPSAPEGLSRSASRVWNAVFILRSNIWTRWVTSAASCLLSN